MIEDHTSGSELCTCNVNQAVFNLYLDSASAASQSALEQSKGEKARCVLLTDNQSDSIKDADDSSVEDSNDAFNLHAVDA